jgi:hypothetical protein
MNKHNALMTFKKSSAILQAAILASAAILPAVLLSGSASAGTIVNRYVDMSATQTSGGSGASSGTAAGQGVTYSVGFDVPATGNVGAVAVEFCNDSPILLDTCTAPTGFDVSGATVANQVGVSGFTVDGLTAANLFVISDATADSVTSAIGGAADLSFDIVGLDNPSVIGTFYARITTYSAQANLPSVSWLSTATGNTGIGTILDDGSVALSVASELTITARVQEVLEFCVGTELGSTLAGASGDRCSTNVGGTNLSLGVVDSNDTATTSNIAAPNDGVAMIRTNAINGAVVYYKAEQNTSSGKLKIAGATCSGSDFDDACFNSVGATRTAIVDGTENFGLALKERLTTSGGNTNDLVCDADYAGDGNTTIGTSCTGGVAGQNYAWLDTGAFDTLASSAGPLDDELVALEFAATASPTTPTGLYTVTANFVATAQF